MMRGLREALHGTRFGNIAARTVVCCLKGFVIGYCVLEYGITLTPCSGPSMEPTIQDGDLIVVEKITNLTKSFGVGDIVICRSPSEPNLFLCKRLIGMPGDLMTSPEIGNQTVPKGRVWLQGDNYENSHDSRHFGAVPIALLEGRAIFKLNTWKPLR